MKVFNGVITPGVVGKVTISVDWTGSSWPSRPAGGTDIKVIWWGPDTAGYPPGYVSGDGFMRYTVV